MLLCRFVRQSSVWILAFSFSFASCHSLVLVWADIIWHLGRWFLCVSKIWRLVLDSFLNLYFSWIEWSLSSQDAQNLFSSQHLLSVLQILNFAQEPDDMKVHFFQSGLGLVFEGLSGSSWWFHEKLVIFNFIVDSPWNIEFHLSYQSGRKFAFYLLLSINLWIVMLEN